VTYAAADVECAQAQKFPADASYPPARPETGSIGHYPLPGDPIQSKMDLECPPAPELLQPPRAHSPHHPSAQSVTGFRPHGPHPLPLGLQSRAYGIILKGAKGIPSPRL